MDFDSDQNFQIEQHYLECKQGIKKVFGDKHIIIGDQGCVKNGYQYHVWGTSLDSKTWFEQNCTLQNAPLRQLKRRDQEIEVNDDDIGMRAEHQSISEYENEDPREESKGDYDDEDEHMNQNVKFVVEGPREEIKQLQEEINQYCQNPRKFFVEVDIDKSVSNEMIERIKKECM